jgi:hypothetical protein
MMLEFKTTTLNVVGQAVESGLELGLKPSEEKLLQLSQSVAFDTKRLTSSLTQRVNEHLTKELQALQETLSQEVRQIVPLTPQSPTSPPAVEIESQRQEIYNLLQNLLQAQMTHRNQEQILHSLASLSPRLDTLSEIQRSRLSKEEIEAIVSMVSQKTNSDFKKQHQLLNQIHNLVKPLQAPTIQLPSIAPWLLGVSLALHGLGVAALVIIFMQVVPPTQSPTMRQQWTAIFQRVDQLHKQLVGQPPEKNRKRRKL